MLVTQHYFYRKTSKSRCDDVLKCIRQLVLNSVIDKKINIFKNVDDTDFRTIKFSESQHKYTKLHTNI